jgi:hypothetical protein
LTWINDVAPKQKIQSAWGNSIRDHVVQVFTSVAERDTNAAKMIEGDLCSTVAEQSLFVRRPSAANGFSTLFMPWTNYTPQYQLDAAFPGWVLTVNHARWRRVGGTAVEASLSVSYPGNYSSNAHAWIFTTPVVALQLGSVIGNGMAWDSTKHGAGVAQSYGTDGNWFGIIDPATGGYFSPAGGTPFMYCKLSYEVADG